MKKFNEKATQTLFEKKFITEEQFKLIAAYRNLNIFSLHSELRFLLYLSIVLFTSGIGILIYQNIDTIGHIAILSLLLIVTVICFYLCFKKSDGFKKEETVFKDPIYDYLVLAANILSCTFIGYLQSQYHPFGTNYNIATLIPTVISFFCAYYFDNKSVLTIAITGLAAFIGLSVSPQDLLNNETYATAILSYSGLLLGFTLILWTIYSSKIELKKHFNLIYLTFSLHLIGIACVINLFKEYWFAFVIALALSSLYFYKISYQINSISLFVFNIVYSFIGFNLLLFKIFEFFEFTDLSAIITIAAPLYFILSIVILIKLIRNFNKN